MQERCDLAAGDDTAGTVSVVGWWVAALGDPGGAQLVNIVLEYRVVIVDEQVAASVIDITDGAYQEARIAGRACRVVSSS